MTFGSGFPTKNLENYSDFTEKLGLNCSEWEKFSFWDKQFAMSSAKFKKTLLSLLTIVGALFVGTAALRSAETAKATGQSFTKAFGEELKILTKTKTA